MVEMDWKDGREIFRLQKMSEPIDTLVFRIHTTTQKSDSDRETLKQVVPKTLKQLHPKQVEVSPIGEVIYVSKQNC